MRTHPGQENVSIWLLSLGGGLLLADLRPPVRDDVEVPAVCLVRSCLIKDVFVNTLSEERRTPVILFLKNDNCLAMNEEVMQTLPGEGVTDSVKCDIAEEADNYPWNSSIPSHHQGCHLTA